MMKCQYEADCNRDALWVFAYRTSGPLRLEILFVCTVHVNALQHERDQWASALLPKEAKR